MELLTASTLQSRHGFPTREGGVSRGAFTSLNSSFSVGDEREAVTKNLELLASAAGVSPERLFTVTQVHGATVLAAERSSSSDEADGLFASEAGVAVGVRTADCLPVLIEDRRTGHVAAVHAGWRGVIAEIVARALEAMQARPADVHVGIGPCIQRCCFEVDGDLPSRFSTAFGEAVVVQGAQKKHLDLPLAVRVTLERLGVPASHVAALPQCTRCDERFFSHRRDHGITGRHLSFITRG